MIKILPRSILSWTPNGRPRKAAKKFAALVVILFPYNVTKDGNALMYIYIYILYTYLSNTGPFLGVNLLLAKAIRARASKAALVTGFLGAFSLRPG